MIVAFKTVETIIYILYIFWIFHDIFFLKSGIIGTLIYNYNCSLQ